MDQSIQVIVLGRSTTFPLPSQLPTPGIFKSSCCFFSSPEGHIRPLDRCNAQFGKFRARSRWPRGRPVHAVVFVWMTRRVCLVLFVHFWRASRSLLGRVFSSFPGWGGHVGFQWGEVLPKLYVRRCSVPSDVWFDWVSFDGFAR